MKPYPGGEDGFQSSTFGIGLEEKEGHPISSWRERGKGKGMETAKDRVHCIILKKGNLFFPESLESWQLVQESRVETQVRACAG